MSEVVVIEGAGVAACCCASLLSKGGFSVTVRSEPRAGSPVLMLSDQTQSLLRDIFSGGAFLQDAPRITKRFVAWGHGADITEVAHSGIVTSESALLRRLWSVVGVPANGTQSANPWKVLCSRESLPPVSQHEFGSRVAATNAVTLTQQAASESCWVEAVESGWMFLIPVGKKNGSLISVGALPDVLLHESRLVSQQISSLDSVGGTFAAHPRIVQPLCGSRWIACGSAALAFDPIAGEGAGHAIRQGILSAAVIQASARKESEDSLLAHYNNRMLGGFLRHLEESSRYYQAIRGAWWQQQLEPLARGIDWVRGQLTLHPVTRFRLTGFDLERF